MEADYPLDDKYTVGIWYNGEIGEFEQYERDADEVIIRSPDGEKLDTVEYLETGHLQKVESDAVENPAEYFQEIIDDRFSANNFGILDLPFREEISFMYARQQIEIVEE